jgi:hypothetical protein
MSGFIKLPDERIGQLRALSKARNMTIVDLIGEFIHEQIAKGNLAADLPGITVLRTDDAIVVDLGNFPLRLDAMAARIFAATLRWHSLPKRSGMGGAIQDLALAVSGFGSPLISRQGKSVVIGEGEGRKVLAPSIAFDLSEIVARAAA